MIYCLDTNIIISVMRKKSRVINTLKNKNIEDLCISDIVRAELYLGCLKSDHPNQERAKVDHIIDPVSWIPFGDDAAEHYASIRNELERTGSMIGPNDLLIAATSRSIGATMVTTNTKGLVVEDWLRAAEKNNHPNCLGLLFVFCVGIRLI